MATSLCSLGLDARRRFITHMNWLGALARPKESTVHSYSPYLVENSVFWRSPLHIRIRSPPEAKSIFEKQCKHPTGWTSSFMWDSGYRSFLVMRFTARSPMHMHNSPAFCGTTKISEPYWLLLGLIHPLRKAISNCHCNSASCFADERYEGCYGAFVSSAGDMSIVNCGLLCVVSYVGTTNKPQFSESRSMHWNLSGGCVDSGLLYHTQTMNTLAKTRWFIRRSCFWPILLMPIARSASWMLSSSGMLSGRRLRR